MVFWYYIMNFTIVLFLPCKLSLEIHKWKVNALSIPEEWILVPYCEKKNKSAGVK